MRTFVIILFAATCLAQLAVPGKMIWNHERLISDGTPYKFQTQPIDPSDPFRGKYITLSFSADHTYDTADWSPGEAVNVVFTTDSAGFATVDYLTRDAPEAPFLRTTVNYKGSENVVYFHLPFDRFYMEESKAKPAEDAYAQATRDTARVCYGLVNIGSGGAVITDVFINNRSVRDIVNEIEN
ncbi:MAG TPA: GDYXXLXY domain-containing protein [Chryseolinea sp.]|nr:GDYXXLXY domain-containing protein [Chryseolinea sp.]